MRHGATNTDDGLTRGTATLDEYLTTEELAQRWHTTPAGILNLRHRGNGPRGHRLGRRVLFKVSDVLAFEATRADDGGPPDAA